LSVHACHAPLGDAAQSITSTLANYIAKASAAALPQPSGLLTQSHLRGKADAVRSV
jgi:hypothetical protein